MSRYSQRVKGKRSWKPEGLGAMMEVLAWQYGERMNEFNHRISEVLNHVEFTPLAVKNVVKRLSGRWLVSIDGTRACRSKTLAEHGRVVSRI